MPVCDRLYSILYYAGLFKITVRCFAPDFLGDLTSCEYATTYFRYTDVKDTVYVPPLSLTTEELYKLADSITMDTYA